MARQYKVISADSHGDPALFEPGLNVFSQFLAARSNLQFETVSLLFHSRRLLST